MQSVCVQAVSMSCRQDAIEKALRTMEECEAAVVHDCCQVS